MAFNRLAQEPLSRCRLTKLVKEFAAVFCQVLSKTKVEEEDTISLGRKHLPHKSIRNFKSDAWYNSDAIKFAIEAGDRLPLVRLGPLCVLSYRDRGTNCETLPLLEEKYRPITTAITDALGLSLCPTHQHQPLETNERKSMISTTTLRAFLNFRLGRIPIYGKRSRKSSATCLHGSGEFNAPASFIELTDSFSKPPQV
ncbi:hypothetical protein E5D57_008801 [Metarhizium anisopliae]|nr:hypothetical protein E5D57_008801 [Metarhizium anisopliae]